MSDGGREGGRENDKSYRKSVRFGRVISRIAVAQICETAGFQSVQGSALEALSDIVIRYICDLGKSAHFYANVSGRTQCNVFDVVQGLEDLTSSQGFSGASDVGRCLVSSGVIREINHYLCIEKEVPFAGLIPRFPIARQQKSTTSSVQVEEAEALAGKGIPTWLPALPDPDTYTHTPVSCEKETDPRDDKNEQVRQQRKAKQSLLSLQQRLAFSGSGPPGLTYDGDMGKGKQGTDSNPFLSPPLPFGEKEVSQVDFPVETAREKKGSVLQTFMPVIEAVNCGALDLEASERKILPDKRPAVHFKVGISKKLTVSPSFLSSPGGEQKTSWGLRDNEKDDKKWRAGMILKEAMENPQELTQL